jgi:hypothetical protein
MPYDRPPLPSAPIGVPSNLNPTVSQGEIYTGGKKCAEMYFYIYEYIYICIYIYIYMHIFTCKIFISHLYIKVDMYTLYLYDELGSGGSPRVPSSPILTAIALNNNTQNSNLGN